MPCINSAYGDNALLGNQDKKEEASRGLDRMRIRADRKSVGAAAEDCPGSVVPGGSLI